MEEFGLFRKLNRETSHDDAQEILKNLNDQKFIGRDQTLEEEILRDSVIEGAFVSKKEEAEVKNNAMKLGFKQADLELEYSKNSALLKNDPDNKALKQRQKEIEQEFETLENLTHGEDVGASGLIETYKN